MIRSISIKYFVLMFGMAVFVLFVFYGLLTYHQMQVLKQDLQTSYQNLANDEIRVAIDTAHLDIKKHAVEFASWEEVTQQIDNPYYYAYWYNHRSLNAGVVPDYVVDVAIYDKSGNVLSKIASSTLPDAVTEDALTSYIDINKDKVEMVVFEKIEKESPSGIFQGYISMRSNLIPELIEFKQYNYVDHDSIKIKSTEVSKLLVSDFSRYISYDLRPNPIVDDMVGIVKDMLFRMALIIIVPTLLMYPFVSYLVAKPLKAISRHIDSLKNKTASIEANSLAKKLPVSELEKVRNSLNEYHQQLFEVHKSLDDKNRELWNMAHHDPLTGALNRRAFDEHWRSITQMFSGGRMDICLAIFDVNNFKALNDTYGHQLGDEVLKGIAQSIMKVLRKGEHLYRLGGDEFATVFINCTEQEALHVAERCHQAVVDCPFNDQGVLEPVRISIGLSETRNVPDHEMLLALQWQADVAMYSAKQPGKANIAVFSEEMTDKIKGIFSSWVNNIVYEAIASGDDIVIFYQPIVRLEDRVVEYYEALVRIEHDGKMVLPSDVFQIVEARSLDAEMDIAILEKIYHDLGSGKIPTGTGVSINVSGLSIVTKDVLEILYKFTRFIDDYKLVIEVTETSLITQIEAASKNLNKLREKGFYIALDDFGSGYSSVRYLGTMPVDIVKFDISLIRSLADESQQLIVKHLAEMIAGTGHKLVAEGIETEDLLKKVNELEFFYGQGYLFGRPEPRPLEQPGLLDGTHSS
ncbi:MAG: bifunctional diguanylate cyclase/phosphodiesterase [Gammaproteobacteria bacterium]|nr:bifunctional diguanylate cyclase/phosphodiesterase [Gammaproteobacteria bacterium]